MVTTAIPAGTSGSFATHTARRLLFMSVLALAACSTTNSPQVASDYDRGAQFGSFHRFAVIVRPHPSIQSNPLVEQRAYEAIRQELTGKGFAYVPDPAQADFAVDFSIGAQDRMDLISYPGHFAGPWGPGAWGNEIDVRQYHEGTLAVDVFDVQSRKAVWHGTAKKELSREEMERSEPAIREAVSAVLANFPPT